MMAFDTKENKNRIWLWARDWLQSDLMLDNLDNSTLFSKKMIEIRKKYAIPSGK